MQSEGYNLLQDSAVYFDQQEHAWACVRMVKNDGKHWKMTKEYFSIMHTRGSCETHEEK